MKSFSDYEHDAFFGKNLSVYQPTTATPDFPDFRALCAELVKLLQNCPVTADTDWIAERMTLLYRVRTALKATSPPEPPTDQEIQEWADAKLGAVGGDPEAFGWGWRCFKGEAFAVTIRAALERWGHR